MSQPRPKSNFIQTLLIVAVVFLGMQLFFPKPQAPTGGATDTKTALATAMAAYDKAKAEYDAVQLAPRKDAVKEASARQALTKAAEDVIHLAPTRAHELRAMPKDSGLAEARVLELKAASMNLALAKELHDFNKVLAAYNEFHRLASEAPDSDVGRQAKLGVEDATAAGNDISRNHNNGPTHVGYSIIDGLVNLFGGERAAGFSYWFTAIVMAVAVRGLIWPLATKQMVGFKRMALLQPMMAELKEKYQGPELQQRTMRLYAKYGINPLAGCWPMLIQMPIFLWVFYSMRTYQFEFHKGTFLWVNQSLAAKYPGIIAPNLGEKDVPLVLIYGISMVATSLLSVNDPSTAKQARITGVAIGILFTVMMLFWSFPSAFILYWIMLNVLATIQSVMISRSPIPPLVERPDHEIGKGGMFGGLVPSNGPSGNGAPKTEIKTGAPVVHKPKRRKKK
jgi:YidC/Oxa1 family membrane protein insertase